MIKAVLFMVYMYNGTLTMHRQSFDTMKECAATAMQIIAKQEIDPNFDHGLSGACVESLEVEA